jgi:lysophospholipase L1-like esterase
MLRRLAGTVAATLVVLGVAECVLRVAYLVRNSAVDYVPLPYVIGQVYGPVPPWVDGLRLLENDDGLLWRGRPNVRRKYVNVFSPVDRDEDRTALLRRFIPILPASLRANPVWEVSLDAEGFREVELPRSKPPSVFRIVCLGDSWTFGANVAPGDSYPRRLEALLRREAPGGEFEVLNLGVLGYSSYQGLELLRRRVLDLEPDLLIVGFAMNDASVAGYHDKDGPARPAAGLRTSWFGRVLEHVELYKLEQYAALRRQFRAPSLGEQLQSAADSRPESSYLVPGASGMRSYAQLEGRARVSTADYAENVGAIIDVAKSRDIGVMLLYAELAPNSPYRRALADLATRTGVPLIDGSTLVADARRRMEDEVEERLGLRPPAPDGAPGGDAVTVVLRVRVGTPVSGAVYLAAPALAAPTPNTAAMYDDGTHGDQRAGDGVWSYAATVPRGTRVFYVYTDSGTAGAWDGLDVPEIRAFTVEAPDHGEAVYRPIDTFGRIYMQADSWHTDAAGYDLIARALLGRLKTQARVNAYLSARATMPMAATP